MTRLVLLEMNIFFVLTLSHITRRTGIQVLVFPWN
jgi:hypothetical protein